MKYYEAMTDKYGFDDGGNIPVDAWHCRDAYVAALNEIAERFNSKTRAVIYNRPGVHNSCMIANVSLADYEAHRDSHHEFPVDAVSSSGFEDEIWKSRVLTHPVLESVDDCIVTIVEFNEDALASQLGAHL